MTLLFAFSLGIGIYVFLPHDGKRLTRHLCENSVNVYYIVFTPFSDCFGNTNHDGNLFHVLLST